MTLLMKAQHLMSPSPKWRSQCNDNDIRMMKRPLNMKWCTMPTTTKKMMSSNQAAVVAAAIIMWWSVTNNIHHLPHHVATAFSLGPSSTTRRRSANAPSSVRTLLVAPGELMRAHNGIVGNEESETGRSIAVESPKSADGDAAAADAAVDVPFVDDDIYISNKQQQRYPNNSDSPQNNAFSGLTNAWGYSARLVTKRERRRYEQRRIRHRLKLEETLKRRRPDWAISDNNNGRTFLKEDDKNNDDDDNSSIGAADAFVGNVKKGGSAATTITTTTTSTDNQDDHKFDDDEMDEDGYWGMLGKTKRSIFKQLLRIQIGRAHV